MLPTVAECVFQPVPEVLIVELLWSNVEDDEFGPEEGLGLWQCWSTASTAVAPLNTNVPFNVSLLHNEPCSDVCVWTLSSTGFEYYLLVRAVQGHVGPDGQQTVVHHTVYLHLKSEREKTEMDRNTNLQTNLASKCVSFVFHLNIMWRIRDCVRDLTCTVKHILFRDKLNINK